MNFSSSPWPVSPSAQLLLSHQAKAHQGQMPAAATAAIRSTAKGTQLFPSAGPGKTKPLTFGPVPRARVL